LLDEARDAVGLESCGSSVAVGVEVAEDDELVDLVGVVEGVGGDVALDDGVALRALDDSGCGGGGCEADDLDDGLAARVVALGIGTDDRGVAVDREGQAEGGYLPGSDREGDGVLLGVDRDDLGVDEGEFVGWAEDLGAGDAEGAFETVAEDEDVLLELGDEVLGLARLGAVVGLEAFDAGLDIVDDVLDALLIAADAVEGEIDLIGGPLLGGSEVVFEVADALGLGAEVLGGLVAGGLGVFAGPLLAGETALKAVDAVEERGAGEVRGRRDAFGELLVGEVGVARGGGHGGLELADEVADEALAVAAGAVEVGLHGRVAAFGGDDDLGLLGLEVAQVAFGALLGGEEDHCEDEARDREQDEDREGDAHGQAGARA